MKNSVKKILKGGIVKRRKHLFNWMHLIQLDSSFSLCPTGKSNTHSEQTFDWFEAYKVYHFKR